MSAGPGLRDIISSFLMPILLVRTVLVSGVGLFWFHLDSEFWLNCNYAKYKHTKLVNGKRIEFLGFAYLWRERFTEVLVTT